MNKKLEVEFIKNFSQHIKFISLSESHFPLLLKWLETPHVKACWDQDIKYDLNLVNKKFDKYIHGIPISNALSKLIYAYIVYLGDAPIGYIQTYNANCYAEKNGLNVNLIPTASAGMDMFIGEENFLNKGFGSLIIESFWQQIVSKHFDHCLVDPDANNIKAIRAYVKAGFTVVSSLSNDKTTWMIL